MGKYKPSYWKELEFEDDYGNIIIYKNITLNKYYELIFEKGLKVRRKRRKHKRKCRKREFKKRVNEMCRMVLGFTSKPTQLMHTFFNEWHKSNWDGFGYYVKTTGNKEYILKSPYHSDFKMRRGIRIFLLHCRQKTSGETGHNGNGEENHPFVSEDRRLLLVHNGYLWGYKGLVKHLKKSFGHKFASKVDSEVLLHLWENYHKRYGITVAGIRRWLQVLNHFNISGTANVIVYDTLTEKWFAYSGGSIVILKPLYNNDLFVASESNPIDYIPLYKFRVPNGYAVIGQKNKVLVVEKIGDLGRHIVTNYYKYKPVKQCGVDSYDLQSINNRFWGIKEAYKNGDDWVIVK